MQTSMQHRIIVNLLLFSNYYAAAAASNNFDQPKSKLIKNTQQKHRAHQYLKSKSDDDSNLDDIYTSKPISTEIILGLDLDRQVMYFAKFGEKKWGGSTYKEFKQEVAVEGPGKIKGGHDMTEELSEIFGKHDNFAIKTSAKFDETCFPSQKSIKLRHLSDNLAITSAKFNKIYFSPKKHPN